jgi:hypothetical protein
MAQARAFKAGYAELAGPYIAAGRRMPSDRVTAFPRFHYEELPLGAVLAHNLPALALLALAVAILVLGADRRLRRHQSLLLVDQ